MTKADRLLFAEHLKRIKQIKDKYKRIEAISELCEMVDTYHAAIDLGYPRSCLDKIIKAENMRQVSNIMCSERRRQIA